MSMAPQGETVDLAGGVLKVSSVGIGAKNPAYIMILWVWNMPVLILYMCATHNMYGKDPTHP